MPEIKPILEECKHPEVSKTQPCDLCQLMADAGGNLELCVQLQKLIVDFRNMIKTASRAHQRCAGCFLCFGGEHIAHKFEKVEGVGEICQWCSAERKKLGDEKWLNRIGKQHKEMAGGSKKKR
jgi:hypothetical protein